MKLQTLKSRIQVMAPTRIIMAPPSAAVVERKRGSAGVKDRNRIKDRDCGLCQMCQAKGIVELGAIVDHRTPLWAGGSDEDRNKWLLCKPCHDAKTAHEAGQRACGDIPRG